MPHRTISHPLTTHLAALFLVLYCGFAAASDYPQQDALISAYYSAINRGDYRAAAALVDADSARALRTAFNRMLITENAAGERRLLDWLHGPEANLIDGIRTEPLALYERVLRSAYRDAEAGSQTPTEIDVVGHVREYSDVIHILVRDYNRDEQGLYNTPRVFTARENREGWRLMVPHEIWASYHRSRDIVARYVAKKVDQNRSAENE